MEVLAVLGALAYSLPRGCWRWDEANAEELQVHVFFTQEPAWICCSYEVLRFIRLEEPLKGLQGDVEMGFWVCMPSCRAHMGLDAS